MRAESSQMGLGPKRGPAPLAPSYVRTQWKGAAVNQI